MITIKEEKKMLRCLTKKSVNKLTKEYCENSDKAIKKNVLDLPEYKKAQTLICYVGTAAEINTTPIIVAALNAGKRVGVPLCIDKGIMEMREIKSLSDLQDGFYGIKEPRWETRVIAPEEIDLALIPCVSCNKQGQRLGYGGGYYDRYLNKVICPKVMLCREKIMQDVIPVEAHDLVMDMVVTEEGVISIQNK